MAPLQLLAISGSLRLHSSNSELLRACAQLAPPHVRLELFAGLDALPYFNADLDTAPPPPAVAAWRAAVGRADGLLLSSPEYARGVPGALKNALDWLVGGSEIVGKPVALLNGSPRSTHAQTSLPVTLQTMSAELSGAPFLAPVLGRHLRSQEIAADAQLAQVLRAVLAALEQAAERAPHHG